MIRSHGKVLIVDDESAIRRALHNTLHGMGFDVDDASCGEAALDLARDAAYDVVLMDINMPGIGGIRACRELRKKLPRLGILMLTVRDCEEDKVTALDAGADDYITPAYTVVSARHHMLWPATVRRIDVPACVWVCCASLGGVLGPSRTAGTGGPHHPGTWLLSRPNFASSFASFWSNTTCWGLLKQPYKQKPVSRLWITGETITVSGGEESVAEYPGSELR